MKVPAPAVAGLNVPVAVLVMPVPLHVPPPVAAVKFVVGSDKQKGPDGVIVAFGTAFTLIFLDLVEVQPPTVTE